MRDTASHGNEFASHAELEITQLLRDLLGQWPAFSSDDRGDNIKSSLDFFHQIAVLVKALAVVHLHKSITSGRARNHLGLQTVHGHASERSYDYLTCGTPPATDR